MSNEIELNNNIHVIVNKKDTLLKEGTTVIELLELLNAKNRSAVWINGKQLLLAEYLIKTIRDGGEIKVLRVIAGG